MSEHHKKCFPYSSELSKSIKNHFFPNQILPRTLSLYINISCQKVEQYVCIVTPMFRSSGPCTATQALVSSFLSVAREEREVRHNMEANTALMAVKTMPYEQFTRSNINIIWPIHRNVLTLI